MRGNRGGGARLYSKEHAEGEEDEEDEEDEDKQDERPRDGFVNACRQALAGRAIPATGIHGASVDPSAPPQISVPTHECS